MASADERLVGAAAAAMASAIPSDLGVNRFLLRLFAQKKSMSEKDSDPIPGAPSRSPRSRSPVNYSGRWAAIPEECKTSQKL